MFKTLGKKRKKKNKNTLVLYIYWIGVTEPDSNSTVSLDARQIENFIVLTIQSSLGGVAETTSNLLLTLENWFMLHKY